MIAAFARKACAALAGTHAEPVVVGVAPARPGLYAIHAPTTVWKELGLTRSAAERALYVGKSESSLAGRDVSTHFGFTGERRATSVTGYSTVRRSLAALLHDANGYRGTPRNQAAPGHYSNYGLIREHDEMLSAWMRRRLQLAFWEKPEDCTIEQLERVERAVFDCLLPPLNLKDVVTPWKPQLEQARIVMTREAKAWRPPP